MFGPEDFSPGLDPWGADELDALSADPAGAGRLGQVLAAAGAPAEIGDLRAEDAARHAFRVAYPASPAPRARMLAQISRRVAAAGLAGGLVLSGTAAAAGVLPGEAQQTAKSVLAKVGISVPGPTGATAAHRRRGGPSAPPPVTAAPDSTPSGDEWPDPGGQADSRPQGPASTGVTEDVARSGPATDGKRQGKGPGKPDQPETASPDRPERAKPDQPQPAAPETAKLSQSDTAKPDQPETLKSDELETAKPDQPKTARLNQSQTAKLNQSTTVKPDHPQTAKADQPESAKAETATPGAPKAQGQGNAEPTKPEFEGSRYTNDRPVPVEVFPAPAPEHTVAVASSVHLT